MNNLKSRCVELLTTDFCRTIQTQEQAELVFETVKGFIKEEKLEEFIKDDLCVFPSKEEAYDWFTDDVDLMVMLRECKLLITEDMIGKSLDDAIAEILLDDKENYIKVNEDIHLTHWL